MENVFIARQPIFRRGLKLHGYEIHFRPGVGGHVEGRDLDHATSEVILNTFTAFSLNDLVGSSPAFINFTRHFLLQHQPLPLPESRTVIEILDHLVIDNALVQAVQNLKESGYRVALGGGYEEDEAEPLLHLVDIFKVHAHLLEQPEAQSRVEKLQERGIQIVADRIETKSQLARCQAIGCEFFQGNFLSRPEVSQTQRLNTERATMLSLLGKIHDPGADLLDLEAIISRDVALSYQLLRYINSAYYRRPFEIRSLRQAVMMLGMRELKRWASIVSLNKASEQSDELIKHLLVRARMAELLAEQIAPQHKEACFLAGLFSDLDQLLAEPMEEVIRNLPIAPEIAAALTTGDGPVGHVLQAVLAYERGDAATLQDAPLSPTDIRVGYLSALQWQLNQPIGTRPNS